jgi:hypothetical protein
MEREKGDKRLMTQQGFLCFYRGGDRRKRPISRTYPHHTPSPRDGQKGSYFMALRTVQSALLAALIALPMYYMIYSMFRHGFETGTFITALAIGIITFAITFAIAYFIGRSKQRA